MVLHPAVEVRSFDTFGFPCKGLFVKPNHRIAKGEHVWWWLDNDDDDDDDANDENETNHDEKKDDTNHNGNDNNKGPPPPPTPTPTTTTLTKQQIQSAPTTPMTLAELAAMGLWNAADHDIAPQDVDRLLHQVVVNNPRESLIRYSYMLDDDSFEAIPWPEGVDESFYYNHSCNPNTGFGGSGDLIVALRDIHENEQLVYDYAFTETERSNHYGLLCKCSLINTSTITQTNNTTPDADDDANPNTCRGFLDMLQYKDPVFIEKYFEYCTPFIQRKMKESLFLIAAAATSVGAAEAPPATTTTTTTSL